MRSPSRFIKLGIAVLIGLFMLGSLHTASVDAHLAAQATMEASASVPVTGPQSCPTLDMSMLSPTMESTTEAAANSAPTAMQPGFLNVQIGAVDNCGVQILQVFSSGTAAQDLQVGDIVVAVDCVPLADIIGGTMATATADSVISNCMQPDTMSATGAMPGVLGAMSSPACMNTGVAGGTLRITSLFFCIIGQYHAGDTIALTLWRGSQQMNVEVNLDVAPAATLGATEVATTAAGGPAPASSGATATSAATTMETTTPTMTETPVSSATAPATP